MAVRRVDGKDALEAIRETMRSVSRYHGYSSDRSLRYHAFRWFARRLERGQDVTIEVEAPDGSRSTVTLPADRDVRYLPRLPVPHPGISDSANVSWRRLDGDIGQVYVRRIGPDLIARLDEAIGALRDARGLIVDVRGNSGGGFDAKRAHRNFVLDARSGESGWPRYEGPIALLLDARCISAGEGWASWFVANDRARSFGETTAGASARKTVYTLKNGLYRVRFPVRPYTGFLDRPIERRGLEPDVPLKPSARDIAAGRDTVLEAARAWLDPRYRAR
jgi:C-terminal processing protease CtpA/Prc